MNISNMMKVTGTVVSLAKPIIEDLAPKIQMTLKNYAERLLLLTDKYPKITSFTNMLDKTSKIIGDVLFALGVESDSAEIIGIKISQSDKRVDEFDTFEEYISYLRNKVELDKNQISNISDVERIAYTAVGLALQVAAVGGKLGVNINVDAIEFFSKVMNVTKIVIETKDIIVLINTLKDSGITDLSDVMECIEGKGNSDRVKTGRTLEEAFEKIKPNEGKNILNTIIDEIRE